jgi:hypothetical protein
MKDLGNVPTCLTRRDAPQIELPPVPSQVLISNFRIAPRPNNNLSPSNPKMDVLGLTYRGLACIYFQYCNCTEYGVL